MIRILFIGVFIFSFLISSAQHSIQGFVYDGSTGTPLTGANVFIANSTKGTSTALDGSFTINGLDSIHYELVISFIGYKTQVNNITAGEPQRYKFTLEPDIRELKEVVVRGKKISWLKQKLWLGAFEVYFIGRSDNHLRCKLENPWVLDLDKEGNVLTATADSTLILRNGGLGYRVKILLNRYKYNQVAASIHFEGFMVYEPMTPANDRQKRRWAKNRLKAYYGSQMHFLRSLYNHRANEEGFYFTLQTPTKSDTILRPRSILFNNYRVRVATIRNYDVLFDSVRSTKEKRILNFVGPLEVNYIHEGESVPFQKQMKVRVRKEIVTTRARISVSSDFI